MPNVDSYDENLSSYFRNDHWRLEALLKRVLAANDESANVAYSEFRSELLRHIALEEKILMPAIMKAQNGVPHPYAGRLRSEHGAFAALLVPSRSEKIINVFLGIMRRNNGLEEGADGLYAACENLPSEQIREINSRIKEYPSVPVMPHSDKPNVLAATRRAVSRAGHDFDELANRSVSE